jgi:hypothetical protein
MAGSKAGHDDKRIIAASTKEKSRFSAGPSCSTSELTAALTLLIGILTALTVRVLLLLSGLLSAALLLSGFLPRVLVLLPWVLVLLARILVLVGH